METVQNKEVYEVPRAEISLVSMGDILVDSNSTSGPKDPNQTEIDWDF